MAKIIRCGVDIRWLPAGGKKQRRISLEQAYKYVSPVTLNALQRQACRTGKAVEPIFAARKRGRYWKRYKQGTIFVYGR